jgi:hypothetical protein
MARAKGSTATVGTEGLLCLVHRVELRGDGWCPIGDAYATNAPCPFVCPICRGPLNWTGGCNACHGCTTGDRADWTFPGDRYERDKKNPGHYVQVLKAGRAACTPRENIAAMQIVQAVLAKKLTVAEAERHLATIFQGRERIDE